MNAPLDALHEECMQAQSEIRRMAVRMIMAAEAWTPAEMPPQGPRPHAVWLDEQVAIPVTTPSVESDFWQADDPLLRSRKWLRTGDTT